MKFLVYNYCHYGSTQASYILNALNKINGCEAVLFDNNRSVYDNYDYFNPDVVITNAGIKLNDVDFYQKNVNKNIQHLISLDYLNKKSLVELNEYIENGYINCTCFFGAGKMDKKIKLCRPYVRLQNALDDTAKDLASFNYKIKKAVVISKPEDIDYKEDSFHIISTAEKTNADMHLPCSSFRSILKCYEEVIFQSPRTDMIEQSLIEAIYFANQFYLSGENVKEINLALCKLLDIDFDFSYSNKKEDSNREVLGIAREKIRTNHKSVNRIKTLLSQLKGTYDMIQEIS